MATHEQLGIHPDTPCFWCNTNRQRPPDEGGSDANGPFRFERLMHANNCAAMWLPFQYQDHVQHVREGSIILMYAKRVGIIGVGQATGPVQRFACGSRGRIDELNVPPMWTVNYPNPGEEWRIPLDWLRWWPSRPCGWCRVLVPTCVDISGALRHGFQDVSGANFATQRLNVWRHFHL